MPSGRVADESRASNVLRRITSAGKSVVEAVLNANYQCRNSNVRETVTLQRLGYSRLTLQAGFTLADRLNMAQKFRETYLFL
jgi:hypothetical protein